MYIDYILLVFKAFILMAFSGEMSILCASNRRNILHLATVPTSITPLHPGLFNFGFSVGVYHSSKGPDPNTTRHTSHTIRICVHTSSENKKMRGSAMRADLE